MKTELCERLGIDFPIIQAPIGSAAGAPLAAAVSDAGGLGSLAVTAFSAEVAREKIREVRARTSKPFSTNLLMSFPYEEVLEVCLEERVPAVSFFWGDPSPYVERFHAAGATVLLQVGSVEEARQAVDAGVDIIVAQGWEAGGHVRGDVATLPLVPSVVDAVAPVPVVAAGGIVDGRGLAAVLALGAAGAWIGTRFLASEEVSIHPHYRERVLRGTAAETVHTMLFDVKWPDAPHRVLRSSTFTAWEAAGRPSSGQRPGEGDVLATDAYGNTVVRYQSATARSDHEGDIEAFPLWAGQGVGLVNKVQPAGEIVREIAEDAKRILKRLADNSPT
jgi:NAD(P)H-dependent flavin oxidoreductase YrpB (nitropropane dioxygenase family)